MFIICIVFFSVWVCLCFLLFLSVVVKQRAQPMVYKKRSNQLLSLLALLLRMMTHIPSFDEDKEKHEYARIFARCWHSCVAVSLDENLCWSTKNLGISPGHSLWVSIERFFFHPPSSPISFFCHFYLLFPHIFYSFDCLGFYKSVRRELLNLFITCCIYM